MRAYHRLTEGQRSRVYALKKALEKSDLAIHCPEGKCLHLLWVIAARWPKVRWNGEGSALLWQAGPLGSAKPVTVGPFATMMRVGSGMLGLLRVRPDRQWFHRQAEHQSEHDHPQYFCHYA